MPLHAGHGVPRELLEPSFECRVRERALSCWRGLRKSKHTEKTFTRNQVANSAVSELAPTSSSSTKVAVAPEKTSLSALEASLEQSKQMFHEYSCRP